MYLRDITVILQKFRLDETVFFITALNYLQVQVDIMRQYWNKCS